MEPAKDEKREARPGRDGARRGEPRSEGRDEGRPGRAGGRSEGRNDNRGGRGGRGGNRADRPSNGQRERLDADGKTMSMAGEDSMSMSVPGTPDGAKSENRNERPARNAERGGRGERVRNEGNDRSRNEGGERAPSAERSSSPRPEGVRNERRPDRSRRVEEGSPVAVLAQDAVQLPDELSSKAVNSDMAVESSATRVPSQTEGSAPREKRSRDRYGRERGPRAERSEADTRRSEESAVDPLTPLETTQEEPRKSYFTAAAPVISAETSPTAAVEVTAPTSADKVQFEPKPAETTSLPIASASASASATVAPAPVAPTLPSEPVQVQTKGMPKLETFVLPLSDLTAVAQSSGLNWVNSDSEKIAAVQAAIAAEAKPIHVPRPRPAPVQIDTGSLVLVETKRDLRDMTLPFEEKTPD